MRSAKTRHSLGELTLEDLDRHAVGEFALGEEGEAGQDETIVRPHLLGDRNPYSATSN